MSPFKTLISLALLVSTRLALVQASVYVTNPVQSTVCNGGQSCSVEWVDNGESPLLSDIGECTVGLYNGEMVLVQSLTSVNVANTNSFTFTPNPSAGDNGGYYLVFTSTGTSYQGWSGTFTLNGMTGGSGSGRSSTPGSASGSSTFAGSSSTTTTGTGSASLGGSSAGTPTGSMTPPANSTSTTGGSSVGSVSSSSVVSTSFTTTPSTHVSSSSTPTPTSPTSSIPSSSSTPSSSTTHSTTGTSSSATPSSTQSGAAIRSGASTSLAGGLVLALAGVLIF